MTRLVAFDTQNGTGDELACIEFLYKSLSQFSPDTLVMNSVARSRGKTDSGYVLARWGDPKVLLNVHIDTVPIADGWSGDAHKIRQHGDKYLGLGTSDIKGAAACILAGLAETKPKDVAILFSGDEEHGSEVMPAVIQQGQLNDIPLAIVCEPTGCRVGRQHRGMLAFSIVFSGPGGHSSLSDETSAPLQDVARLAVAIGDYGKAHSTIGSAPYAGLCTNIGKIDTDGAYNVIPTQSRLWFSMRPPPGDDVIGRKNDMIKLVRQMYPDNRLETLVAFPAFASKNIKAFQPYFGDFDPVDLPYWTEAAMLSNAGINTVVYGPGDVDQAHKPDEYVTGAQLHEAALCYMRAISGL